MTTADGVMRMRPVDGPLALPPGATVELKPGGYHVMFMNVAGGFREGESVPATLTFERAGPVAVLFRVGGIGARAPEAADGGHHHP